MSASTTVIQHITNNDGSIGDFGGMYPGTIPPELQAAIDAKREEGFGGVVTEPVPPVGEGSERPPEEIEEIKKQLGDFLFMNQTGKYYWGSIKKHPSDCYIPFPSPELLQMMEEQGISDAEEVRMEMQRSAGARNL